MPEFGGNFIATLNEIGRSSKQGHSRISRSTVSAICRHFRSHCLLSNTDLQLSHSSLHVSWLDRLVNVDYWLCMISWTNEVRI